MRIEVNGTMFFDQVHYDKLKYKYLKRIDYKKFITELNERRVEDNVINNKEGLLLPFGLGILKITKQYRKTVSYIYNNQTAKKTINNHSLGFIYKIILMKNSFLIPYSKKFLAENSRGKTISTTYYINYMFKPVRTFKRKLAKIIKAGSIIKYDDYEQFK